MLQATRKRTADLVEKRGLAVVRLEEKIDALSFDWDEKPVK